MTTEQCTTCNLWSSRDCCVGCEIEGIIDEYFLKIYLQSMKEEQDEETQS